MCGIGGILDYRPTSGKALEEMCDAMGEAISHRGPDDRGIWADADAGIGLAHRRLSILDLSIEGHQPMRSACGRYVVVYNGEIYNFAELRGMLERAGAQFRGHSDTEVLLAGIVNWGLQETISRANGMFAIAVWDRQERALYLVRDRLGQKPLYYGWIGSQFAFASELKAFAVLPGFSRELNRDALTLFLRHGYIPEPWCIWRGLNKLMPGTFLRMTPEDVATRALPSPMPYWTLAETAQAGAVNLIADEQEAEERLDALLRDAVRLCMVSDVPLGAFLSGGIDSSLVVALMQAQSNRPVRTFTIGFGEDQYDEAAHARTVARHLGTEHTELYVNERDARAVIPCLPTYYDEPFADSSQIPTYLVSRLARANVTVSLSGDGGDELFAGYNRYVWGANLARTIETVPTSLRRLSAAAMCAIPVRAWDGLAGLLPRQLRPPQSGDKVHKLAGIIGASSREAAYWRLTSLWQNPGSIVKRSIEPTTVLADPSLWPCTGSFMQDMMLLDAQTYLPGDILTKVDRASMAVALEARVPLLDHRVVELAWRIPIDLKLRDGTGKWILRKVLDRYIPRELIDRPKMGFGVPIGSWLRGDLKEWAESLIDEGRLRREGFFEEKPIRAMWEEHLAGRRNWQHQLWTVLMFQSWHETWAAS